MSKRILCCVETPKHADTDSGYIRETIRHYFAVPNQVVIRMINMDSKTKYNSRSVKSKITKYSSNSEETHVIYFIDTDNYDVSVENMNKLKEIIQYCDDNNYEFVFFCKDVEDVYLGRRITQSEKIDAVRTFISSGAIKNVNINNLNRNNYQVHCSNILNVLGLYLQRK